MKLSLLKNFERPNIHIQDNFKTFILHSQFFMLNIQFRLQTLLLLNLLPRCLDEGVCVGGDDGVDQT